MVTAAAAPGRLEEILQFEEHEQDRFLSTHYSLEEVQDTFFGEIDPSLYRVLRQKTKDGLQQGLRSFLDRQVPPPASIYLADKDILYEFCFDGSTEQAIRTQLKDTPFGSHQYLDDYCQDVCGGYRLYVLNQSRGRYLEQFEANRKVQYG